MFQTYVATLWLSNPPQIISVKIFKKLLFCLYTVLLWFVVLFHDIVIPSD